MSLYIDPSGHANFGIGICGRCSRKFPLDELHDDPNIPGLKVCVADMDEYDPYRLPARQTERISLPFTRPDEPLTFNASSVSEADRAPAIALFGTFNSPVEALNWTTPQDPTSGYRLYRSLDGGAYTLLGAFPPNVTSYNDTPVDNFSHSYDYYVTYIDFTGVESARSNIVSVAKVLAVIMVCCQSVLGGTNDQTFERSVDGGATWTQPLTPNPATPIMAMAQSVTRGEILAVGFTGTILRSTDNGATWADLPNNLGNIACNDCIRVDAFGLYMACGSFGQLLTSPDGAVWTVRAIGLFSTLQHFKYDPVTGKAWVGTQQFLNSPLAYTTEGTIWTLSVAAGFGFSSYEIAFSAGDKLMNGSRGDTNTQEAPGPAFSAWSQVAGIGGGQTFVCYDPLHDNFVAGSTSPGIFTTPATGATNWTSRASTLPFQGVEDMIYSTGFGKLMGITPIQGSNTQHRLIQCADGVNFTQSIPGWATTASPIRIYEFTF